MLPKPSLTFTVPSLHDGLPIDCRVYHPHSLAPSPSAPPWQKHAAVVAHPYAPLGGCYDDPIVDIVAGTLLRLGFLVGTFNFRGAHGSAGRTTWTAKAERADYQSVVGFMYYYVHFLEPLSQASPSQPDSKGHGEEQADADEEDTSIIRLCPPTPDGSPLSPARSAARPVLLLGGYSYGAMITSQLPSLDTIMAVFRGPVRDRPAAEIRLRAQHMAEMQNRILASARHAAIDRLTTRSPRKHAGMRVGGDEESRSSHESRRPLSAEFEEAVRHGVAELMARAGKRPRRTLSDQSQNSWDPEGIAEGSKHAAERLPPVPGLITYRPAYLLVSPLQGIITNLATMSLPSALSGITGKLLTRISAMTREETAELSGAEPSLLARATAVEAEDKLVRSPTLAIYGDRDGFVPVRKLREWASRLEGRPGSKFRAHEVSSANHFWAQGNVASTLKEAVRAFGTSLLGDSAH
ncbi:uncharacterized protein B0T15DRAFT_485024 [Chaetomium strumarium]|uniref:Uncharacterized protein n=1 Tax=Chaetomium strumarium TaxID=1170767 RepID=A0AAJ0M1E9_9PEZI|nr:hypothetical protein B0T15DRAFT_485024 [Chaetomium strumarium]